MILQRVIEKIKAYFNNISKSSTLCLLLPKNETCGVSKANILLSKYLENCLYLNQQIHTTNVREYIDFSDNNILTSNIIILGHPTQNYRGLMTYDNSIVVGEWFNCQDFKFQYLYAHVCNGAKILSDPSWDNHFLNWASFDDKLFFVFNNNSIEKKFIKLFKNISLLLRNNDFNDNFQEVIINAIDSSFERTVSEYNEENGDQLVLLLHSNILKNIKFNP